MTFPSGLTALSVLHIVIIFSETIIARIKNIMIQNRTQPSNSLGLVALAWQLYVTFRLPRPTV